MRKTVWVIVAVAVLAGVIALAGCGERKETQLQGAPSASQPPAPASAPTAPSGTHAMPGGEQMPGAQHQPAQGEAPKPAATATSAKEEMATCPVLGTTMSKEKMIPYEYKGKTYYFCCPPCVEKFKKNPEQYIKNPAPAKPAGGGM